MTALTEAEKAYLRLQSLLVRQAAQRRRRRGLRTITPEELLACEQQQDEPCTR